MTELPELGFFTIIILVIAAILTSLIPALFSKILMSSVFDRRVSFGMVLLGTTLGVLILMAGVFVLSITQGGQSQQQPLMTNIALTLGSFLFQALVLAFTAPDENMQLIAFWKWLVVLVLQYVIFIVLGILVGFLLAAANAGHAGNLIQTRMV